MRKKKRKSLTMSLLGDAEYLKKSAISFGNKIDYLEKLLLEERKERVNLYKRLSASHTLIISKFEASGKSEN